MTFSRRVATLTAVVLIPIGIAGTSFLLGDDLETPSVPAEVDLEQTPGGGAEPTAPDAPPSEPSEPREDVVPRPSPTEGSVDDQPGDDDLDDDPADDADDPDDPATDDDGRDGADDG
ncbi:small secreted hydrophilic protein [Streptomyces mayteni]